MRDFGAWYDNVFLGVPEEYEEHDEECYEEDEENAE